VVPAIAMNSLCLDACITETCKPTSNMDMETKTVPQALRSLRHID